MAIDVKINVSTGVVTTVEVADQAPTADDVRAEAQRRMMQRVGARSAAHLDVIIANGMREQGRLLAVRTGIPGLVAARAWTVEETARAQVLWAADQAIEAIRAASNAMEPTPPADFADDACWPE